MVDDARNRGIGEQLDWARQRAAPTYFVGRALPDRAPCHKLAEVANRRLPLSALRVDCQRNRDAVRKLFAGNPEGWNAHAATSGYEVVLHQPFDYQKERSCLFVAACQRLRRFRKSRR